MAQLGARINRTDEVRGSNPLRSTSGSEQWTDVLQCSLLKTKYSGPMAQLGARLNGIEEVEGSNPSGSTLLQY